MKKIYKLFLNMSDNKKIKSLLSSMITGNKSKSDSIIKELIESVIEDKEKFLIESYFANTFKKVLI